MTLRSLSKSPNALTSETETETETVVAKATPKRETVTTPKRGRGRPLGSTSPLPRGSVRAIKAIKKLERERLGGYSDEVFNHPIVKEAMKLIHDVMTGKATGRYIGDRMRAASMEIEFIAGRLKQRNEMDTGPNLADLLANVDKKK